MECQRTDVPVFRAALAQRGSDTSQLHVKLRKNRCQWTLSRFIPMKLR